MSRKNFGMEGSSGIKEEQQVWQISEWIETRFFSLKIKKKSITEKEQKLMGLSIYEDATHTVWQL